MTSRARPDPQNRERLLAWQQAFADGDHEDLSEIILEAAPDDWDRIFYRAHTLINCFGFSAVSVAPDGKKTSITPDIEVLEMFGDLRPRMYLPGIGAWFSVDYTFDRSGNPRMAFDYASDPFNPSRPPEAYAEDFDYFPRDVDFVPDWLKSKLDAARKPAGWYIHPQLDGLDRPRKKVSRPTKIQRDDVVSGNTEIVGLKVRDPATPRIVVPTSNRVPTPAKGDHEPTIDDLKNEITRLLTQVVPPGWASIRYSFREIWSCRSRTFEWIGVDGRVTRFYPEKSPLKYSTIDEGRRAAAAKECPPRPVPGWREDDLFRCFSALRRLMYIPGNGTWFTAVSTIDRTGTLTLAIDHDNAPTFFPRLVNGMYARDQEQYPRDQDHIPHWLQNKLNRAASEPLGFS